MFGIIKVCKFKFKVMIKLSEILIKSIPIQKKLVNHFKISTLETFLNGKSENVS